eukprot:jgi/Mesvir1/28759/Mv19727-RA.1
MVGSWMYLLSLYPQVSFQASRRCHPAPTHPTPGIRNPPPLPISPSLLLCSPSLWHLHAIPRQPPIAHCPAPTNEVNHPANQPPLSPNHLSTTHDTHCHPLPPINKPRPPTPPHPDNQPTNQSTVPPLPPQVVESLNPAKREQRSVQSSVERLVSLQKELQEAHLKVHRSEIQVRDTLVQMRRMEEVMNQLQNAAVLAPATTPSSATAVTEASATVDAAAPGVKDKPNPMELSPSLKEFWYPVAFMSGVDRKTMVPFECFGEPWVLFRDEDGRVACLRDECAHRACPLSLGSVENGHATCPYHGWQYDADGKCTKMPQTRLRSQVRVSTLPVREHDGMIWVYPGTQTPPEHLPSFLPPSNYTVHAEIVLEVPIEHGLMIENLLDLAHAPFTHTETFAKGWSVPEMVNFKVAAQSLAGHWEPYPISMKFEPPCMTISEIGLAKPGQLEAGKFSGECKQHLHQMHVCMPAGEGRTRILYRMCLDFAHWVKYVPGINKVWSGMATQVLGEDLRLVEGQQDRMMRGADIWFNPVAYDKLGVRYRSWRRAVERNERSRFIGGQER